MQRLIFLSLIFLLISITSEGYARQGKDYALLFAIEDYSEWKELQNPIDDVEAIAQDLDELYGFQTEIVRNATRAQIRDKIFSYANKPYQDGDQLLVFFSGHGHFIPEQNEGFFIPQDGKRNDPYQDSYISFLRLRRWIDNIPCRHILLALDACFSGTIDDQITGHKGNWGPRPGETDAERRKRYIDLSLKYQSRLLLTSGGMEGTPDPSQFAQQFLLSLRTFGGDDAILEFEELYLSLKKASPIPHKGEFGRNEVGSNFLFILSNPDSALKEDPAQSPVVHQDVIPPKASPVIEVSKDLPGPPMTFVQGGTFSMGCTSEQKDCEEDERTHTTTVSDFYIGKYEVTFDAYQLFCDATSYSLPFGQDWGRGQLPVIEVSWYDAIVYCNWLSEEHGFKPVYKIDIKTKDFNNKNFQDRNRWVVEADQTANGYRLPTEAEWEYAARQRGQQVLFGNGKMVLSPDEANFDSRAEKSEQYAKTGKFRERTVNVGTLGSPNSLDLYDMSGNVWEWCWDWYSEYPQEKAVDYFGPSSGKERVLRGGSWSSYPPSCRVARRFHSKADNKSYTFGFRLARYP